MLLEGKGSIQNTSCIWRKARATITSSFLLAYVRTDFSHLQIRPLIPQVRVRVRPGVEVAGQNASHLLLCDIFPLHLSSPKWVPSRHVWYASLPFCQPQDRRMGPRAAETPRPLSASLCLQHDYNVNIFSVHSRVKNAGMLCPSYCPWDWFWTVPFCTLL